MSKLILLNTPIGNISDVSARVLTAYKEGIYFFAEDTRNFKALLNHLGVSLEGKLINSFHDHSGDGKIQEIINLVESNDVFLVSDAGSPIVSDPAYPLIKAAYQAGIEIDSYSGVSSVTMALELSGLPPVPYTFLGFLARDKSKMTKQLMACLEQGGTFLFFESPKRVEKTVELLSQLTEGSVEIAVIREMSKQFQQIVKFNSKETSYKNISINPKGEFVVVFYSDAKGQSQGEFETVLNNYLEGKQSKKELSKLLSKFSSQSSKELYALLK